MRQRPLPPHIVNAPNFPDKYYEANVIWNNELELQRIRDEEVVDAAGGDQPLHDRLSRAAKILHSARENVCENYHLFLNGSITEAFLENRYAQVINTITQEKMTSDEIPPIPNQYLTSMECARGLIDRMENIVNGAVSSQHGLSRGARSR